MRNILALYDKRVSYFKISVENFKLMKRLETSHHVYEEFPNVALLEELRSSGVLYYFHVEIASVCILHDYTERLAVFLEECLFVSHDVGMSK